jgi:hypothetical protein
LREEELLPTAPAEGVENTVVTAGAAEAATVNAGSTPTLALRAGVERLDLPLLPACAAVAPPMESDVLEGLMAGVCCVLLRRAKVKVPRPSEGGRAFAPGALPGVEEPKDAEDDEVDKSSDPNMPAAAGFVASRLARREFV